MKTNGRWAVVAAMVLGCFSSYGQAIEPEVPGDHFSLEGALELFKKSESPQDFERLLNSPDAKVNNLDLNGDGYIDYIRVVDRYERNVHAFILQAVISDRETQDIAVIELEKRSNGEAVLQIVGDESVYGVTTIIEPTREVRTYAGTRSTPAVVNVWTWPAVRYVYGPSYHVWISPWGWHHHPRWYRRWRPVAYVHYYPIWRPYYSHYTVCHTRRVVYAHEIYRPYRTTSVIVRTRYNDKISRYRDDYRAGRTREDDRRAFVRNSRSSTIDADRRRETAVESRRPSSQHQSESSRRSESRERNASTELRNDRQQVQRGDAPNRSVTVPTDRQRSQTVERPSTANRSRTAPAPQQVERRPQTSAQQRSATPDIRREPRTIERGSTQQSHQPASRPSLERYRSGSNPAVQERSPARERTVSPPASRPTRQPSARPSSGGNRSSSVSPRPVHKAPDRVSDRMRSGDVRRGRQ